MSSESSLSYDPVTALPWSSALLPSAASLTLARETQVVYLQLHGLAEVGVAYGDRVAQLLLRQLVRRLRSLLDQDDLVGRHTDTSLLIFTARAPAELHHLASSIHQQVKAAAILTRGSLLPEPHVGVANVRQAADEQDALVAVEAAVTAAEQTALGRGAWEGPFAPPGISEAAPPQKESIEPIVGPREVPAPTQPPKPRQPQLPAASATPERRPGEAIVIRRIGIAMEGAEATAMVTLTWGAREAEAEVSGTNSPRERLVLVGEAAAAAVMKLTSGERSVSRVSVDEVFQENDRFVRAVVEISGPGGPEQMSATARIQGTTYSTVAQAVVQAMEPRIREILETS